MNKLPKTIGSAPSEMTSDELEDKLRKERERVTSGLEEYFNKPTKATRKPIKPSPIEAKLQAALDELGMTIEEFREVKREFDEQRKAEQEELEFEEEESNDTGDDGEEDL